MDKSEFNTKFLENRDHTGRFYVKSLRTGKTYYVEPLDVGERRSFGDINPATGKVEGSYGTKYKGAIHPSESLITEENGFDNITVLPAGKSPYARIEELDELLYQEMLASGKLPA